MIYRVTEENLNTIDENLPKWFFTVRYCGDSLEEARVTWHRGVQGCSKKRRMKFERLDDKSLPDDEPGEFELMRQIGGE